MKLFEAMEQAERRRLVIDTEYSHESYWVALSKKQFRNFLRQICILERSPNDIYDIPIAEENLLNKDMLRVERKTSSKKNIVTQWDIETKSVEISFCPDLYEIFIHIKKY